MRFPFATKHRWITAGIGMMLLVAACGGDDPTVGTSATTEAGATATEAPTTGTPATTVAETAPPETAPPATEPPSTEPPGEPPVTDGPPPFGPTNIDEFRAQPTACGAEQPPAPSGESFEAPDDMGIDAGERLTGTIATSCGDITFTLDPSMAPATVNSFVFLAEAGYFDGTASHRIIEGFVIQAGDPTATGRGEPGYVLPDEFPEAGFSYGAGVLAMANAGPGSTGSQFFIMIGESGLPPQFSVFGTSVVSDEVLAAIIAVPKGLNLNGEQSVPLETIYIETVTIDG